jgi:miniconductance mechanosensitive channel
MTLCSTLKNGWDNLSQYSYAQEILTIATIILGSLLLHIITKRIIFSFVHYVADKSKNNWDDILVEHKVFQKLSSIVPALFIYLLSDFLAYGEVALKRISLAWVVLAVTTMLHRLVDAGYSIYKTLPIAKDKGSTKGFSQLIKFFLFLTGIIIMISVVIGKSPVVILSGIGAMTAVLLLVFRDTLLSFVASIQISTYNTLQLGDWIEMPEYDANGDVVDISLHTIQVQNWDKTIVSIPTHNFLDTSFKNWRGMFQSGGRRIKRSIHLDMTTISFCDTEMIKRFKKIEFIKEYLEKKEIEIASHNIQKKIDIQVEPNGRRLTNIGTFRAYIKYYLKNSQLINKNLTFLVRQLAPTDKGLPIEIYIFTKDTRWSQYEDIQSDIFDHVLAVIPAFELRVFQSPTGFDWHSSK